MEVGEEGGIWRWGKGTISINRIDRHPHTNSHEIFIRKERKYDNNKFRFSKA